MAPATNKRKRPGQQASEEDSANRPSPYKPEKSGSARRVSRSNASAEDVFDGQENDVSSQGAGDGTNGTPQTALAASNSTSSGPTFGANTTPALNADSKAHAGAVDASTDTTRKLQRHPYRYIYITDDFASTWSDSGRSSLIQAALVLDQLHLSDLFVELVRSALESRLDAQSAGLMIREIINAKTNDLYDTNALFLDTVQFLYDAAHRGQALRPFLAAAGVSHQTMREQLDHALLMDLGLVRTTFERMRTRKTTNLLYRQANFNLLREESEGYAKLITEYFNTAQEASRRDVNPYMAEDAFQRVKALVGAFDLDVGRVLDITLDVSANLLVKAYPFFIKFYRASSWWPSNSTLHDVKWEDQRFNPLPAWAVPGSGRWGSNDDEKVEFIEAKELRDVYFWDQVSKSGITAFFEIGARKIIDFDNTLTILEREVQPEVDNRGKETNPDKRLRLNQDREYMRKTKSLPPSGNHDAAQLLGFKLRFYASEARDAADLLPDNLIFLTALLIKIGFISLRDLYPHLHPSDAAMPIEEERLRKEKAEKEAKERPGGGTNALLTSGPLVDDTVPPPRRTEKEKSGAGTPAQDKREEPKEELPPPSNQKLLLLKGLLLVGALPEALFILGRFPGLVDADISIPPLLHRIARHMLSKVSDSLLPLTNRHSLREAKEQLVDSSPRVDGTLTFGARPPRRSTRWLWNDVCDKEDGYEYRHYYVDWNDNIPVCQNIEDVFELCNSFLGYLGATIGQDVMLYGTLLRLAHRSLTENSSKENRARWQVLIERQLVPALSWTKHNPALAQQVFDLLSFYNTTTRYNIYFEWFRGRLSRRSDVKPALARNRWEVRDVLRRISNDYVKKQSRALAKIAISSPGVVMLEMIGQLESYSNMIPSLVECTRFFSPLAWDILTWALINSLGGQGRDRMQADGMLTSSWLQALSQFVASLYTRYGHISVSPILQYLASELRIGNSTDLELLEQLLVEMAGVRSDMDFNDNQIIAMAGGPVLRTYILSQLSDSRHTKHKSANRLMEALGRPGLTGQVLVAIAQERQMYSSHESSKNMPLKVLGNNIDKIQAIFYQYLEVLKTNLKPNDFEAAIPDAVSLVKDFGLEPSIALTICRTAIRGRMDEFEDVKKQEREKSKKESASRTVEPKSDVTMKEAMTIAGGEAERPSTASGDADSSVTGQDVEVHAEAENEASSPWHPVLEPIIHHFLDAIPDLASRISIPFYVTFWTLDLYDVLVPMDTYSSTVRRLDAQIAEITNDRSDVTQVAAKARESKKKGLIELRDKLKPEPSQHISDYIVVKNRISRNERFHYFPKSNAKGLQESKAENDAKHQALLQECFLPRAMMTSLDAQFSFQVIKMLHDNGTPGFSLMHLLHQLFRKQELSALIFQCTLNEAQNLGRFLSEILKHLHTWHTDRATYEKEALGLKVKLPGFVKTFDERGEPKLVMDYENFRRMLFNCHAFLNGALQACFESGEYMHIRNGIIVLKSIHQVFPALKFIGKNMMDHVTRLSQEDPRQDLKLAAMSLLGPLKSREKQWVLPQAFRLNDSSKDAVKPSSRAPSARPETPQPGAHTPTLNAAAPEFKPPATATFGNTTRKESLAGGPEDGEIEDDTSTLVKDADNDIQDENKGERSGAATRDFNTKQNEDERSLPSRDTDRPTSMPSSPPPPSSRPPTSGPQHMDTTRASSMKSTISRHQPQDLPSRAEIGRPQAGHPPTRTSSRYSSRADEQYGRLDRPNDTRSSSREHSPGYRPRGRTPPTTTPRSYNEERPFDRNAERVSRDMHRGREESYVATRRDEHSQGSRTPTESKDRPPLMSRASEGLLHPERQIRISSAIVPPEAQSVPRDSPVAPAQQDADPHVNPERLAMINNDNTPNQLPARRGREVQNLGERELHREDRPDDRVSHTFAPRSDAGDARRASGRGAAEPPYEPLSKFDHAMPDLAPTGPKRGGRLRDGQGESNYGRLNGPAEPPSGPRQSNGPAIRGARNFTTPANIRAPEQAVASPVAARTSEFPPVSRGPSRQSIMTGPPQDRNAGPDSAPSTPLSEPAIHPSRAAQFSQAPPLQTNFPMPNGPRHGGSPTTGPPSGPRGPGRGSGPPNGTPTGPAPASGIPPSGPASTQERQRRQERQRQNINATLQGSTNGNIPNGGQGVNFRGASNRQASGPYPTAGSRASVPSVVASPMEPPPIPYDARPPPEDPSMSQITARPDLFHSRSDRSDDPSRRRDETRTGRQHASRDLSREPRADDRDGVFQGALHASPAATVVPPNGQADGRNHRGPRDDRRGREERHRDGFLRDGSQYSRDMRRAPERQAHGPPSDMAGGFATSTAEWDRTSDVRGPPRRDGPEDSRRGGRGGGPGRPEEFRREDRVGELGGRPPPADGPPGDGSRKRRHEDVLPDGSKRRRSGR